MEVDILRSRGWDLTDKSLWEALSWAAFTGRVAAMIADPPMRTWNEIKTGELPAVRVRSCEQPWGEPGLKLSTQGKVDEDTLLGIQPLWLWTVASIAKGEGIPMCYTEGVVGSDSQAWHDLVTKPFAAWSNCSLRHVPWTREGGRHTRQLRVCSNLGLKDRHLVRLGSPDPKPEVCTPSWADGFRTLVQAALFHSGTDVALDTMDPQVCTVEPNLSDLELIRELNEIPLDGEGGRNPGRKEEFPERNPALSPKPTEAKGAQSSALTEEQREGWRRHLQAHHVPFRKDCLQCVMSGALGLQHRRVKCPNMYALSFDLAGPFKELGKDDRGGKYRYALVAGLRVPCEALPPEPKGRKGKPKEDPKDRSAIVPPESAVPGVSDREGAEHPGKDEEDVKSIQSWFDPSDYDPDEFPEVPEEPQEEEEHVPVEDEISSDPWEDHLGISKLSDEEFDKEIAKIGFSGENRVLRFVVPMKGRKGSQIQPALQEVITECHRLGFPVKSAHTDRAREAVSKGTTDWLQSQLIQPSFTQGDDPKANGLAERLVGWVKTRARLHLSASGLGLEHWPTAMALACAEHRHRILQLPGRVHQYGQRVVFKSKHATGESKKPFLRWEYGTYLCPCPRTDKGHILLRESSGGYLVARNVKPMQDLVDPEREFQEDLVLEAQVEEEPSIEAPQVSRRVTGKRAVRVVTRTSEQLARSLMESKDFSAEACGRLLTAAFGDAVIHSRRTHRGPVDFSIVLGAYGHGGLRGITRATQIHPQVCRYLNQYLRQGAQLFEGDPQWSALTVVQADEVRAHKDSRNEPGTCNYLAALSDRSLWVSKQAEALVRGSTKVEEEKSLCDAQGGSEEGVAYQAGAKILSFDPKHRHALGPATNWVVAGYSPLGTRRLPAEALERLKDLGFDPPLDATHTTPRVCKVVGPNPQRMPMPTHRQRPHRPIQTRHLNVRFARIPPEEWRQLCELDEDQFEAGMERWTQVLSGETEGDLSHLSAAIPRGLMVGTLRDGRRWNEDPVLEYRMPTGELVPVAQVFQYTDDDSMYLDDSPFPDRLMMFDILDIQRDVREVIVIRVMVQELRNNLTPVMDRVLREPGPEAPEVMAVQATGPPARARDAPRQLPIPLPNPTALKPIISCDLEEPPRTQEELSVRKAEVATTDNLESVLETLTEPLNVTHTAAQGEVRQYLERWRPAITKELDTLKGPGVLVSHFGKEAQQLLSDTQTTVIPLKGVFTAKAPAADSKEYFRRKCRLVACGNQAPYNDAESLYASGAPAELVRAALVEASDRSWEAFTCDIRSAFTLTPIPKTAGRRYVLRPPKWLITLGLAQEDECYTLGKVLYGFREAPVWWSEFRDETLRDAKFGGCTLEQGSADTSVWRIVREGGLQGYLITYVDDFLVLSTRSVAQAFHEWILRDAKWETDGLSEAREGSPVRFLGMQLERFSDGSFTLDQEGYIDELIRSHGLTASMRSRITCPREVLYGRTGEDTEPSDDPSGLEDETTVKQAQRVAGECLWLSQRTRVDVSYTTSVMCSLVATEPQRALTIGKRLLMYLAQTKDYRLRLKANPAVPTLRAYTDASFAPEGTHSFGGHILEYKGVPTVWRAGRQQLISMSSAECELVQVVEAGTYTESFMALLEDLGTKGVKAHMEVDNTAAVALVKGGCSQRTRHLKVRAAKLNQLLQQGWTLGHCQGLYQKADILTKPLPSARLKFLCDLLNLGPITDGNDRGPSNVQKVRGVSRIFKVCLVGVLTSLQGVVCKGQGNEKPALEVEWPWELLLATILIILSTVCLWETAKGSLIESRPRNNQNIPRVRAVSAEKERRAKRLQERVQAAIETAVSETSPSGGSGSDSRQRRGRNKCPVEAPTASMNPVIQAGVVHVHSPADPHMDEAVVYRNMSSSSTAAPQGLPNPQFMPVPPPPEAYQFAPPTSPYPVAQTEVFGSTGSPGPSRTRTVSQVTQTDPVVVLGPESSVYLSAGGHCIHCEIGCTGLRNAGHIHTKNVCQYCFRKAGPRTGF